MREFIIISLVLPADKIFDVQCVRVSRKESMSQPPNPLDVSRAILLAILAYVLEDGTASAAEEKNSLSEKNYCITRNDN